MDAYWFGVPFSKLQRSSGMFWVLPIDYNLYVKAILGIFVFLFICEVTTTKVNFRFDKHCSQAARRLLLTSNFCTKCLHHFISLIFFYTLKKIPRKKYVSLWKWNLKRTLQSAQNSFSRKSNSEFCIIFNISFVNAKGSVKIRLACLKVLLLINYSSLAN